MVADCPQVNFRHSEVLVKSGYFLHRNGGVNGEVGFNATSNNLYIKGLAVFCNGFLIRRSQVRVLPGVFASTWLAIIYNFSNVPFELYNLNRDISEKANLAANYPDIIAKIESFVATARTEPRPQIEPEKPAGRQ